MKYYFIPLCIMITEFMLRKPEFRKSPVPTEFGHLRNIPSKYGIPYTSIPSTGIYGIRKSAECRIWSPEFHGTLSDGIP